MTELVGIYLVVTFISFGLIIWRFGRDAVDHQINLNGADITVASILALAWPVVVVFALLVTTLALIGVVEKSRDDG